MNSNTVDLIATDPPFNKGRDFHATPDKLGRAPKFQDRWSWERDVHETWTDQLANDYKELMEAIESARYAHSDSMGAYMCFMAVRLLEMHRILKPTGSIYIHCDPTASHYLKAIMDAIFGWKNFRNEVIWYYRGAGVPRKDFARRHDIILRYSKISKKHYFNPDPARQQYAKTTIDRFSHYIGNVRDGVDYGQQKLNPKGKHPDDVITDIQPIAPSAKERLYPTQKPLELYERIIQTSSGNNDIVFDPFVGGGTTCVAAERQNREWIGIDIWDKAHEIVLDRIKREDLSQEGDDTFMLFSGTFHYRKDIPVRDDDGVVIGKKLAAIWVAPNEPWEKLTNSQMKSNLVKWQKDDDSENVVCAGCGRILEKEFMEIDHLNPRSNGGSNFIDNRILLCRPCNSKKSNKLTMIGLRSINKKIHWMRNELLARQAQDNVVKHGVPILKNEMSKPNV